MIWLTLVLAFVGAIAVLYNRLVRARNRVDTAWSDIDVQLQRRHELELRERMVETERLHAEAKALREQGRLEEAEELELALERRRAIEAEQRLRSKKAIIAKMEARLAELKHLAARLEREGRTDELAEVEDRIRQLREEFEAELHGIDY